MDLVVEEKLWYDRIFLNRKQKHLFARSRVDYRYDRVNPSNYSFLHQCKVFEQFKIAVINICVNTVYTTKSRSFRFLNIIYTILIKIEVITILPTSIKTFLGKGIRINTFLKYKISARQSGDFSYQDKKTTRYTDMFQIRFNFCKA